MPYTEELQAVAANNKGAQSAQRYVNICKAEPLSHHLALGKEQDTR